MGKIFMKVKDESYELLDKETGEVSELYETFVVNDDIWFKLYVTVFCDAIGNIKSLKDIQLFALCLKMSIDRKDDGNMINTSDYAFKNECKNRLWLNRQNLWRGLKNLCDSGLLHKVDMRNYRINPQIAYCGSKHDRAKLILKIVRDEL